MPSIPFYLVFFTLIIVVLPSLATIFLRLSLYENLLEEANKVEKLINGNESVREPEILQNLKRRFKQASLKLDNVNTAALIDQIYSQKTIKVNLRIFNTKISCEQIDYFCRILPNLLLAFGLLGTFIGITINLLALSQTITENANSNVSNLVSELERPLQGMGIAFFTSLTGLLFSALLTVFNWSKNTTLAKYRLISSLEDYLDNVYQPTIDGHTRLDKAVDRMANLQNEFLTNFGNNVRDVVEKSLGKVVREIAEENKKANELARQVYEGFLTSSGTISAAANEFKISSEELKEKAQIFKQAADTFEHSQFPQRLLEATGDLANTQKSFSQSAASLAETVEFIATGVSEIQRLSHELINLGEEIKSVNQTSTQVLELHQNNQNYLGEIIPQLKQGATNLERVTDKIDNLEQRMQNKTDSLNNVEVALIKLLSTVKNYTQEMNSGIESLSDRFVNQLSQGINTNNEKLKTIIVNFEGYANQLNVKMDTFRLDFMQLMKDNNSELTSEYENVGDRLVKNISKENTNNLQNYKIITEKFQECIQELSELKQQIAKLNRI